ncbi:hypothetical protein ERHA54_35230 [Erwinia rhapontici]|uniref:hypothetical protein n=1 Tax=Erwinia rhapontici TaxID=55212 RepID=UPI001BB3C3CB|nr:hypothetical protein [Erwinia rhapontici]BCQ40920.1 hypothetical protein ERHA54_35230 [Erwinia rhapontici]
MITLNELKKFREDAKNNRKNNRDLLKKSLVDFFQTYTASLGISRQVYDIEGIEFPYVYLIDSDGSQKEIDKIIIESVNKANFQLYTVIDDNPSDIAAEKVVISVFISNNEACYKISGLNQQGKSFNGIRTQEQLVEISEFIKQSFLDKVASEYEYMQDPAKDTVSLWD